MAKAYSYLRFSTPEQTKGDSHRRQTEAAKLYADRHGLLLDEELTFQDLGVSAFRGRNAERGSLADFRLAVQTGTVEAGSYLLIESFDRLSRMDPWEAFPIFQEIINAGITVVTLTDGREWNREGIRGNPFRIMESLLVMMRAHVQPATVQRYVTIYRGGGNMPPVKLANIDGVLVLVDGWHRLQALRNIGQQDVDAEIVPATDKEARWEAAKANLQHGLQLKKRELRSVFRL